MEFTESGRGDRRRSIFRFHPSYLFNGAFTAILFLLTTGVSPLQRFSELSDVLQMFSTCASAASLAAAIVFGLHASRCNDSDSMEKRVPTVIGSVLLASGFGLLLAAASLHSTASVIIGGVLFGTGVFLMTVSWAFRFLALGTSSVMLHTSLALLLSSIPIMACNYLPFTASMVDIGLTLAAGVIIPLLVAFKMMAPLPRDEDATDAAFVSSPHLVEQASDRAEKKPTKPRRFAQIVKFMFFSPLLGMSLASLTYSASTTTTVNIETLYLIGPLLTAMVLVPLSIVRFKVNLSFTLYQIVLPILVVVLLMMKLIPAENVSDDIFKNTMFVLFSIVGVLSWAFIIEAMRISEYSKPSVLAASQILLTIPTLAGYLIGFLFSFTLTTALLGVCTALYFVYIIFGFALIFRDSRKVVPSSEQVQGLYRESCRMLAANHGLTKRESEILVYLARGFTSGYIAKELYITDNTVRNHIKNIYRKLGVNSKGELIKQVDEGMRPR